MFLLQCRLHYLIIPSPVAQYILHSATRSGAILSLMLPCASKLGEARVRYSYRTLLRIRQRHGLQLV